MVCFEDSDYYKAMMINKTAQAEKLMTIEDVAEYTNVKVATLRSYRLKGKLPYLKVGTLLRFRKCDIDLWLEATRFTPDFMTVKTIETQSVTDGLQIVA